MRLCEVNWKTHCMRLCKQGKHIEMKLTNAVNFCLAPQYREPQRLSLILSQSLRWVGIWKQLYVARDARKKGPPYFIAIPSESWGAETKSTVCYEKHETAIMNPTPKRSLGNPCVSGKESRWWGLMRKSHQKCLMVAVVSSAVPRSTLTPIRKEVRMIIQHGKLSMETGSMW